MRILHLSSVYAPHAVGGAERVVQALAEGAASRGLEVGVAHLAPAPTSPSQRNGVRVLPLRHRNPLWIEDVPRHAGPVRNLNKIATLFNVLTASDFDRLLADFQPDIVHSHSMVELTPLMWKAAKKHGAAIVHTLHDYDLLCIRAALHKDGRQCERRHLACAAFSSIKRRFHSHIDRVVGVSNAILQTHLDYGFFQDVPGENRHVVWNPILPRGNTAARPIPLFRNQKRGPYTFGFLGRLVPEKGLEVLLDACRLLGATNWRLQIAGHAGAGESALRKQAAGLPVEFVGYVDAEVFLSGIDTLVVPSIWREPFGLTIIEAYAAGVPVLGADIAGVAEIIRTVDPAALVPPGDAVRMARKMHERIKQGRQGKLPDYSSVLRRTQLEYVVRQYTAIYQACLAGPAVSPSPLDIPAPLTSSEAVTEPPARAKRQ